MINNKVLIVVTITFITIMVWVVLDIIHSNQNVKIPEETQQLLTPVDPNFDLEVVNEL